MDLVLDQKFLDCLATIAERAGQLVMDVYRFENAIDSVTKLDGSPLSVADTVSNDFIVLELRNRFPTVPVLTEEGVWREGESDLYFAVDPLDGTKEFINRNGEFTVNIALVENRLPIIGVVHAPALGLTWGGFAKDEKRSLRRSVSEHGYSEWIKVLRHCLTSCQSEESFGSKIRVVLSRSHLSEGTALWLASLNNSYKILYKGSSLKFCLLADGEADVYPRIGQTKIWDTAAGHAVLVGAGGKVLCEDLASLFEYPSVLEPVNKSFVAIRPGFEVEDINNKTTK